MSENSTTLVLQAALNRLRAGDVSARDELIAHCCNRFLVLTRKMLNRYPRLRNWEETGDVAQNALLRLRRALDQVQPATCREFFGLATVQIRRELMDLTRHYCGRKRADSPEGEADDRPLGRVAGAVAQGMLAGGGSEDFHADPIDDEADDPLKLAAWREFHEAVQKLPDNEREVVELLWYQELPQEEAAEVLGCDRSTVKRRWRARASVCTAPCAVGCPMATSRRRVCVKMSGFSGSRCGRSVGFRSVGGRVKRVPLSQCSDSEIRVITWVVCRPAAQQRVGMFQSSQHAYSSLRSVKACHPKTPSVRITTLG